MAQLTIQDAFDLALQHQRAGQLPEAENLCRQILAQQPAHINAMLLWGMIAHQAGHVDVAVDLMSQAVALDPNISEAHNNLGIGLKDLGRLDEAIAAWRRSIALNPNQPEPHSNLGNALRAKGQLEEAVAAYRKSISVRPDYAEAFGNLGNVLRDLGQLDEAIAVCRQAIALRPDFAEAHTNLGNALRDAGRLDEAIAAYRHAIALRPTYAEAHSNLVFALHFHPAYDAQAIAEEHRRWNRQHAEPLRNLIQPHPNDCRPDRRLRIGYVSADFRNHASALFLSPLLKHHDPQQVEVFCYANVVRRDAMTAEFQRYVCGWRDIASVSDDQVARLIRQDRIDILVDLKTHTAENRLMVFARKPAPVQVTWLGNPGSTGLTTIDYRLSDPFLDPPGMDESVYSERTIRLPETFWCYDPLDGRDIPVSASPALISGYVTFGCLNNFCKINDEVFALWAQVLRQIENSRLLLLAPIGSPRWSALERLRHEGIDSSCVEFVANQPRKNYLETYYRIDLGLDTFPCNGHTTSLDSLWMGVPVVTLVGSRAFARAGWSQLSNLGLTELAAHTPEQFVRIAVDLAKDLSRLQELRSTLRPRMEQSPLMDGPRFARNIEAAYRRMWHTWCDATRD
jgi:protein O-GlcNAc transferase